LGSLNDTSGTLLSGIIQQGKPPNEKMTSIEWRKLNETNMSIRKNT
jgi:hypothetical protein